MASDEFLEFLAEELRFYLKFDPTSSWEEWLKNTLLQFEENKQFSGPVVELEDYLREKGVLENYWEGMKEYEKEMGITDD